MYCRCSETFTKLRVEITGQVSIASIGQTSDHIISRMAYMDSNWSHMVRFLDLKELRLNIIAKQYKHWDRKCCSSNSLGQRKPTMSVLYCFKHILLRHHHYHEIDHGKVECIIMTSSPIECHLVYKIMCACTKYPIHLQMWKWSFTILPLAFVVN